jgi:hypothetical protein
LSLSLLATVVVPEGCSFKDSSGRLIYQMDQLSASIVGIGSRLTDTPRPNCPIIGPVIVICNWPVVIAHKVNLMLVNCDATS